MLLTIGMIVKNEAENLERCLNSLEPVRNAIDTELIIVDTGSTDGTVEIARRYTDKIRHFEWCGDFSAARNESLRDAKGEWFLYLDGDEWFDDCTELIEFFKSGEYKNFTRADYIQRNYKYAGVYSNYVDGIVARMTKILPGTRFENIVHEVLNTPMNSIKSLGAFVHHFGYVELNSGGESKKRARNIEMLGRQIEKNGSNYVLSFLQLFDMYNGVDPEKAEKACRDGIKANKGRNEFIDYIFIKSIASAWYTKGDIGRAVSVCGEYFELKKRRKEQNRVIFTDIDMYGLMLVIYSKTGNAEPLIETADKYISLYNQYKAGKHRTPDIRMAIPMFADDREFVNNNCIVIERLVNYKRYGEALKYIRNTPYKFMIECFDYKYVYFRLSYDVKIACELKEYSVITGVFSQIRDEKTAADIFEEMLIKQISGEIKDKKGYIAFLYENTLGCNTSAVYKKAVTMYFTFICSPKTAENALSIAGDMDNVHVMLSDLLYFMLKFRLPCEKLIPKINSRDLKYYYANINFKKDFPAALDGYLDVIGDISDNSGQLWFSELILYTLSANKNVESKLKTSLLLKFIKYMCCYTVNIYSEDVINDDMISSLSDIVLFGYYCFKSADYLQSGNTPADFESVLGIIKQYISEASERGDIVTSERLDKIYTGINPGAGKPGVKAPEKAMSEFEALGMQVKKNIRMFISQGKITEAVSLIKEYEEINPSDREIPSLKNEVFKT